MGIRSKTMEHAKLMVHAGGVRVTRADLVHLETPAATATWKPLPHHVLVDAIHAEVARRQIVVVKEEFAVQRHTHMLVGTLVLNWLHNEEFAAALACRHANDRSEAVRLYAGVRVFACDNTAVSGDEIILKKKHTTRFDIHAELPEAFDRYKEGTLVLQRGIEALKAARLTPEEAKQSLFDIFRRKIVPLRLFHPVVADWHTATAGSEAGTAWTLHNCFTTHTPSTSRGCSEVNTRRTSASSVACRSTRSSRRVVAACRTSASCRGVTGSFGSMRRRIRWSPGRISVKVSSCLSG
jgi:hypothetical protein